MLTLAPLAEHIYFLLCPNFSMIAFTMAVEHIPDDGTGEGEGDEDSAEITDG